MNLCVRVYSCLCVYVLLISWPLKQAFQKCVIHILLPPSLLHHRACIGSINCCDNLAVEMESAGPDKEGSIIPQTWMFTFVHLQIYIDLSLTSEGYLL